jgi:hypothetical protein
MFVRSQPAITPLRERVSEGEWQARVDLAACYRLAALFGMTDLIYTHVSARVPDAEGQFLINAYGMLFDEITASSLVRVSLAGEVGDSPAAARAHRSVVSRMMRRVRILAGSDPFRRLDEHSLRSTLRRSGARRRESHPILRVGSGGQGSRIQALASVS